jgi:secernin
MCDTLCAVTDGRTLFAKNSDRPPDEPQILEFHPPRSGGGTMRTQYLPIADAGSCALIGSRPTWLWGFEHGVNEHRVAIGNEAVYTTVTPSTSPDGLIGMDLVRLGLERGRSAREAVDVITALLEQHGQSGDCYEDGGAYHSSFLVADPREAWVVETAGRTWAAKRAARSAAISNRICIEEWDMASDDVAFGMLFDSWRDPRTDTSFADVRLESSRACLSRTGEAPSVDDLVALLRDHGSGGAEGMPRPDEFTVCMHIRGVTATTAAIVAELPEDRSEPVRIWAALGSPCVSEFIPFEFPDVPPILSDEAEWRRLARMRDDAEARAQS